MDGATLACLFLSSSQSVHIRAGSAVYLVRQIGCFTLSRAKIVQIERNTKFFLSISEMQPIFAELYSAEIVQIERNTEIQNTVSFWTI